jgi:hypothetical protein
MIKKGIVILLSAVNLLVTSAVHAATEDDSGPFYLLDTEEMRSFDKARKEQYFKSLNQLFATDDRLPRHSLTGLRKLSRSTEKWDALSDQVQATCSSESDLKKACDGLIQLRLDTLNARSSKPTSGAPKPNKS